RVLIAVQHPPTGGTDMRANGQARGHPHATGTAPLGGERMWHGDYPTASVCCRLLPSAALPSRMVWNCPQPASLLLLLRCLFRTTFATRTSARWMVSSAGARPAPSGGGSRGAAAFTVWCLRASNLRAFSRRLPPFSRRARRFCALASRFSALGRGRGFAPASPPARTPNTLRPPP